jgi:hypothetical protein
VNRNSPHKKGVGATPSAHPSGPGLAVRDDHTEHGETGSQDVGVKTGPAATSEEQQRAAGTISLDLLQLLRTELTSLEDRAKFVIPVQLTGLIGLWVQIYAFDKGVARGIAGAALGVLLVSIFTSFYFVRPRALPLCWDRMLNDTVSREDQNVSEIEAEILSTLCRSWLNEAKRLQRGFLWSVGLGALALVLAIAAYIADLFHP